MNYLGEPIYSLVPAGGNGDVVGPATSTPNAVPRFSGKDGTALKNSGVTVSDTGLVQGVFSIDAKYISSTDYLVSDAATDVIVRAAGSYVKVDTDVAVDTNGTVSLTGRASPYGIALTGDAVLAGNLASNWNG